MDLNSCCTIHNNILCTEYTFEGEDSHQGWEIPPLPPPFFLLYAEKKQTNNTLHEHIHVHVHDIQPTASGHLIDCDSQFFPCFLIPLPSSASHSCAQHFSTLTVMHTFTISQAQAIVLHDTRSIMHIDVPQCSLPCVHVHVTLPDSSRQTYE